MRIDDLVMIISLWCLPGHHCPFLSTMFMYAVQNEHASTVTVTSDYITHYRISLLYFARGIKNDELIGFGYSMYLHIGSQLP